MRLDEFLNAGLRQLVDSHPKKTDAMQALQFALDIHNQKPEEGFCQFLASQIKTPKQLFALTEFVSAVKFILSESYFLSYRASFVYILKGIVEKSEFEGIATRMAQIRSDCIQNRQPFTIRVMLGLFPCTPVMSVTAPVVIAAASSQPPARASQFFLIKAITSENWLSFISGLINPASFRIELRRGGPRRSFTVRISNGRLVAVPTKDGVARNTSLTRTPLLEGAKKYQMTRAQSFTAGRLPAENTPGYIPPSYGKGASAYSVGIVLLSPTSQSAVCNHIAIYEPGLSCSFARKNEDFHTLREAEEAILEHKKNGFWFDSIDQLIDHEVRNKKNRLNEVLAYAAFEPGVFGIMIFKDNLENKLIAIIRALDATLRLKKNGVRLPENYEVPIYFYDRHERNNNALEATFSRGFRVFEGRQQQELLKDESPIIQACKSIYDFMFTGDVGAFKQKIKKHPSEIQRFYYGNDFHTSYPVDESSGRRPVEPGDMVCVCDDARAEMNGLLGYRQPTQNNLQRLDDIFCAFRRKVIRQDWKGAIILLNAIVDQGELNTKARFYQLFCMVDTAIKNDQFIFIRAFLSSGWAQSALNVSEEEMKKLLVDMVRAAVLSHQIDFLNFFVATGWLSKMDPVETARLRDQMFSLPFFPVTVLNKFCYFPRRKVLDASQYRRSFDPILKVFNAVTSEAQLNYQQTLDFLDLIVKRDFEIEGESDKGIVFQLLRSFFLKNAIGGAPLKPLVCMSLDRCLKSFVDIDQMQGLIELRRLYNEFINQPINPFIQFLLFSALCLAATKHNQWKLIESILGVVQDGGNDAVRLSRVPIYPALLREINESALTSNQSQVVIRIIGLLDEQTIGSACDEWIESYLTLGKRSEKSPCGAALQIVDSIKQQLAISREGVTTHDHDLYLLRSIVRKLIVDISVAGVSAMTDDMLIQFQQLLLSIIQTAGIRDFHLANEVYIFLLNEIKKHKERPGTRFFSDIFLTTFIDSVARYFVELEKWDELKTVFKLGETHGNDFALSHHRFENRELLSFLRRSVPASFFVEPYGRFFGSTASSITQPIRHLDPSPQPNAFGW